MSKRIVSISLAVLAALVAAGYAAFHLSPWPSVWLIRLQFSKGDQQAVDSTARFVPTTGLIAKEDLSYDPNDRDAGFDVFYPADAQQSLPAIVWVHGGGFIGGTRKTLNNYLKVFASKGFVGVSIDYTLAPTAKFPTPVRQTNAALRHIVANAAAFGIDPKRIFLMGDSAGATIAAQTALAISDPRYARKIGVTPGLQRSSLRGLLLYCGPYDPSRFKLEGPFGSFMRTVIWSYAGTKDLKDPRVTAMGVTPFVTSDFPATFISVGNADPLAPQSYLLAQALRSKGVEVDTLFFPQNHQPALGHEYQMMLSSNEGQIALSRSLMFLRAKS